MSLFKRAIELATSKINQLMDHMEDPTAMLDLSYEKMVEQLQEVKRHLADVVTEQVQLANKFEQAKLDMEKYETDAKTALKLGREDLARAALNSKQLVSAHYSQLQTSLEAMGHNVDALKQAQQKLLDRINAFRETKEITKANYQAAQAQVQVNDSLSGLSQEVGDVGHTMQKAQDKLEKMQARVQAMNTLTAQGILQDPLDNRSNAERELAGLNQQNQVDQELARLKEEIQ